MSASLLLAVAAIGLVPVALSYGLMPGNSIPWLLGFPVEGTNQAHVFRAITGLYLANAAFWLAGAARPALRRPALWVLALFMGGLAAGRLVSLVVDGVPGLLLIAYLLLELAFAALAVHCLREGER